MEAEKSVSESNNDKVEVKRFLFLLWKNRWVFATCMGLGVVLAFVYAYMMIKPMYEGMGVIDTGYILNENGGKGRILNTVEVIKEIEEVFIESAKFLTPEEAKERKWAIKQVDVVDLKNPGLPFVKVTVRGETQDDVKAAMNAVLEYIQDKNKDRLEKHKINLDYLIERIEARIKNIQENTLPYIDTKISRSTADIEELKKELKKESLTPTQYQTLSNYLGQLQISIDGSESSKFSIQNQTLLELEQEIAKYNLMRGDDSIKNASFVTLNITPNPKLGVKRWIILVLGLFSGIVVSVLLISGRELYTEIRRNGLAGIE
ncbi:hypothetical protein [uncultured Helicobacter sp.]|uniref:hypothetical protein n=1 Tax=uncultured Helicobacter sp. TaxID=175537 RepID=UPI0037511CE6